jgi:hypothetical protein
MSNQLQLTGGAKVRDLQDVIIGTSGVLSSVAFDVANGVPRLDVNGKILVSQLPNSVMEYKGVWNAATNTPTLVNGTGNQGDVYLCNVAGTVNFGAGPIAFFVGDQVIYSGSIWQRASGATGTVTSVAVTESGDSLNITGSPITTSGTINIGFNGTNLQYVNGAGNLTTFPTLITSIGLSMPSAFSVANSPLTANGTIAVTGAGSSTQYIDGTGSLQTFPTIITEAQNLICDVYNETGATLTKGTVVYINGGHGNLPTVTKALATSDATSAQTFGIVQTNITNNNNGHVVVIGNLTDLDTQAYAEGTQLYLSSTTAGAYTSVKQYAPAHLVYVAIVVRSHPTQGIIQVKIQNGFEMDELHNVSAQTPSNNQGLFYNTSTSLWENKSIATALGYTPANDALVVHLTGNETIGGTKTFSDATKNNGGIFLQNASSNSLAGYMNLGGLTNGVKFTSGGGVSNNFTLPSATGYTFTFPNATGTLALTSDISYPVTSVFGRTGAVVATSGDYTTTQVTEGTNLYYTDARSRAAISLTTTGTSGAATYNNTTGVFNIPQYADQFVGTVTSVAALTIGTSGTDLSSTVATSTTTPVITLNVPTASATNRGALSSADWTTFNNKQSALTNPVTGTGTTNYLPKFTGASTIGNSAISDNGSLISVGLASVFSSYVDGFGLRATSSSAFGGTGVGVEIGYSGGLGYVQAYNRSTSAYQPMKVDGSTVSLNISGTQKLLLDSSGNLGLGVTPSAWGSGYTALQIPSGTYGGGSFFSDNGSPAISANAYNNSGWKFVNADYATIYQSRSGQHQWFTSTTSGTAGNAITFTQAMTLTAAGRLLLGTSTESTYKLDVNGTGRFANGVNMATTSGNVGIGTNNPEVMLQLGDNTSTNKVFSVRYSSVPLYINGGFDGTNALSTFSTNNYNTSSGSYTWGSFSNTGYSSAAVQLASNTGGSEIRFLTAAASNTNPTTRLTIASTGAATFSSSVTATSGVFTQSAGLSFQALQTSATNSLTALIRQTGAGGNGNQDIGLVVDIQGANDQDRIANFRYFDGTNYNSRFVVQRGGNVGIGTSSPTDSIIGSGTFLDIAGTGGGALKLHFTNATAYGEFSFYKGSNGSYIDSAGAATLANNDLIFRTGGTVSNYGVTERMRITSGGALCLGVTSAYGTNLLNVNGGIYATSSVAAVVAADLDMMVFQNTGATYSKACLVASMTATGGTGSYFFYGQQSTSTAAIKIFSNGNIQNTNNSYGAISDARLKENIKDATPKLDDLMKVKVRNYNLKGESNKQLGVISQELEAIFPNMIEESTNMGENMKIKGVKYSVFVPMLIKAVQEQQQQINELKQLINK